MKQQFGRACCGSTGDTRNAGVAPRAPCEVWPIANLPLLHHFELELSNLSCAIMACAAYSPTTLLQHLPVARLMALYARQPACAGLWQHRFAATLAAGQQPSSTAARCALLLVATAPQATELLAHYFASELRPSDCYLLYGSVGAGKSYFRSFCWLHQCVSDDRF